jgi:hypothetical protein
MIARLLSALGVGSSAGWLVLVIAAGLGGYAHGYHYASTRAAAEHSRDIAQQNEAVARQLAKNMRELRAEQERGDVLAEQLLANNAERDQLTAKLRTRVQHESTIYLDKPGAPPSRLPDRPFTSGWVRDYNAALGLRMPQAAAAAAAAARTAAGVHGAGAGAIADAAELARSAVSQADVLATHIENAAICRRIQAQLNAILDLDEGERRED